VSRSPALESQWEERLDPRRTHPLWGEHRARYRFAQTHARGARVLDAACGNGYGTAMLRAAGAVDVFGIDLSADAIAFAQGHYSAGNVRFLRADLEILPFRDGSFDLVTCFETIEHVRRPEDAVRELLRVLTPAGGLLVSSPNGAFFASGHSGNPFHHTEFRVEELASLLEPHFERVRVFGQRLTRETPGILDYSGLPAEAQSRKKSDASRPSLRRRLFGRLPYLLQDLAWRVLRGESYYPGEDEFVLEAEHPERFPVIVAVCQRE